ncbi:MAG TPA: ABC transporter permease [Bryobacteraceae bacterium]|nr:ABC transporter permease [Bryobacteraceae bacterium]
MSRIGKKLRTFWRRRQLDHDLQDELQFHLDMKANETGDRLEAQRRVGNATALKEACRELWSFAKLESWWQDARYAARMLAKTPGFSVVAIVALGLGIGADTAVFTIANGAFSWDLGLDHLDRIMLVGFTDVSHNRGFGVSYPDFRDLRSQTKSLAGLAAYQFVPVNLSDTRILPERYWCAILSANGFSVSEQKPLLGRVFTTTDERPGALPTVVLSYNIWQSRYGADPAILHKTIRVNDVPRTVIGVMPPGKRFPEEADLWTPLVPDAQLERRDNRSVTLFGRLANSVSVGAARAELSTLTSRLAKEYPGMDKGLTADVQPIARITGAYSMRPIFAALWCAVGFVLLIACADVANMLLARGTGRLREISIRVAIGAGRARVVRQLLIESVTLSLAGGFLGWLVALGGLRWFDAGTNGLTKPVWLNLSLDRTAFTYLAVISIATGIIFGLAPALRLASVDVYTAMKDGGYGVASGRRTVSIANLLVTLEMVLCIVLLAGAGLMIRSTVNLYAAPLGVDTSSVLTMRVNLSEAKYPLPGDQVAFHRALKTRLDSLAGVEASGVASRLPLGGWNSFSYQLEGAPSDLERSPLIGAIVGSPGYFRVMRVTPRLGRSFTESDGISGPPVALVNESFARKFWPTDIALGKRLRLIENQAAQPWLTIVGVLPDILQNFRSPLEREPLIYIPYTEDPLREMFVVARTRVAPGTLADAFRRSLRNIDPNLAAYDMRSLEDRLAQARLSVTLLGGMFSVFAAIALVLASVGLYAVIAHSVSQRTQEIGVRMAMGAMRRDILRLIYAEGARPIVLGLAIGLPAAFGVTHVLRMALVGVSPSDPVTFLSVVLVLVIAGALGCAIPARRATKVDPIVALRYE